MIAAVRREIAQIDAELPFYGVRTMAERLSASVLERRTPTVLATGFALVALLLAGAFLLRQTIQAQLYEVGAMDARVVAMVAGVLMAVALIACVLPARRAAKTDPMIALSE